MRISVATGLDLPPAQRGEATWLFMGISTALMMAVNVHVFGSIWAAFMVALCLAVLYLGRIGMMARFVRQPILILLPCIMVLSCLWSEEFKVSLSLGLQTLLTTITGVTIAQCTTNRQFLHVIFAATSLTCLGCLIHGGQGPSATGDVLIGYLGSKDAMGLFAYTSFMTALAVMIDRHGPTKLRLVALVMALIELRIATMVHATAAILALGIGSCIFLGSYLILSRFKISRLLSYFLIFLIAIAFVCFCSELVDLFLDVASKSFGKDATLTGRTVLWQQAIDLFKDSPLLGHGYRAFWVGKSLEAHRLLYMMHVDDGRAFHFHEQYLETLADTGIVGFAALVATIVIFGNRLWRNVVHRPSVFADYSLAIMVVYFIRLALETAFLPFCLDVMIFYGLAAAAMRKSIHLTKRDLTPPQQSPTPALS